MSNGSCLGHLTLDIGHFPQLMQLRKLPPIEPGEMLD